MIKKSFFKRTELFLNKYKNVISLLFGIFGIGWGVFEKTVSVSYKNNIEYTTKILDSTRDVNGILTVKTIETTLKMKDLKKLSDNGDAKIRELLAQINKEYKYINKTLVTDTVMISTIKMDTIVRTVRDTVYIKENRVKQDSLIDSTN